MVVEMVKCLISTEASQRESVVEETDHTKKLDVTERNSHKCRVDGCN